MTLYDLAARGKSQLGDWLPQKRGRSKNCIALLKTLLQGKFKSPAECAGDTQSSLMEEKSTLFYQENMDNAFKI